MARHERAQGKDLPGTIFACEAGQVASGRSETSSGAAHGGQDVTTMYSRFNVQTRLSIVEAEGTLSRLVDEPGGILASRPFAGRIENGTFKFHRIITGRNSFLPIVTGRIVQGESGAVVRGATRLHYAVAAFMTIWMGMAITAVVDTLPKYIAESDTWRAVGVSLFPVFGIVLIAIGYYPERRRALRILEDAFAQRTVGPTSAAEDVREDFRRR